MKAFKLSSAVFTAVVSLLLISCAQIEPFQSSSVVPGAEGKVKVKQDANKNYEVNVHVDDLAEIEQLDNTKQTYVVWMETKQGNTINLGQLKSSRGLISGQRKASLETVSPYEPFRVFITAEHGLNPKVPGRQVVLTTETF